uniref:non-specific serine/threonine protein kinase n=1 Tax=Oryza meridionalis TaxID=40149 RepID=A0A0E0CMQ5_9ORYZ
MWRFNPFGGKVQNGLEGRTIDVGNIKITVRNAIAQGGFSCVYLASDAMHPSKQYAMKHIICNDSELLDLVMKEIQVMNLLKGHPNVVTPVAHDVFDMGRTKEALLVMEFCEKSLVSAMESRGTGYYEEKKALLIFRDVCNAVFAMHGQSPPIAHRPEEMGIEEDIIRKHTTPAYRAPEMWDLYRREVISEKVDIWVWFRVNELLPLELQKNLPDGASSGISMSLQDEGAYKRTHVMPRRNPPPPPREQSNSSLSHGSSKAGDAPLGAFWVTQHAQGSQVADNRNSLFDEEPIKPSPSSKHNQSRGDISISAPGDRYGRSGQAVRGTPSNSVSNNGLASGANTNLFMESQSSLKTKTSQPKSEKDPFNSFVADFEANNLHSGTSVASKESELEAEVSNLKEQLKKTSSEKAEMTAKFEKLSAICRSQRQEIQELKRTLAETTPPPSSKVSSRLPESGPQRKEKIEGTVWELEQGMLANSSLPSSEAKTWQAFPDPKSQPAQVRPKVDHSTNGAQNLARNANSRQSPDGWGFGPDSFRTSPGSTATQINRPTAQGSSSQRFSSGAAKKVEQPSGVMPC